MLCAIHNKINSAGTFNYYSADTYVYRKQRFASFSLVLLHKTYTWFFASSWFIQTFELTTTYLYFSCIKLRADCSFKPTYTFP